MPSGCNAPVTFRRQIESAAVAAPEADLKKVKADFKKLIASAFPKSE